MDIRILPSNIANMIAAGEVVQRPSSVVKELMENAVDAGASQVTVVILDAGRTLVQVIDNGCGMTPDEAVLCFERHATSKLATAEDLHNILTFGFRGEALASIAAVAEVTLKTKKDGAELGCQVDYADSQHLGTEETATPAGTNIAVRNLFYNVPARRKFLKSDNVEFKHIVAEFTRIALTRPEIGFTLTHNGKDVYVLRPAKSLKFRIQAMFGSSVVNEVVDVHTDTSVVTVDGFVSRPNATKKSMGNQYFFVNGRFFKSPYLHRAVMKGYEQLIPDGISPSYFLYLNVNPESVDVNIHPTKTEIKFEQDSVIFQILYACIKEALGKHSFVDTIDFDREGITDIPVFSKNYEEFRQIAEPQPDIDMNYNPFDNDGFPMEESHFNNGYVSQQKSGAAAGAGPGNFGGSMPFDAGQQYTGHQDFDTQPAFSGQDVFSPQNTQYESFGGQEAGAVAGMEFPGFESAQPAPQQEQSRQTYYGNGGIIPQRQDYGKLFEDSVHASKSILTVRGKYIVTTSKSGLMIVNVRRAMERILYERFLSAVTGNAHLTQTALFPVTVRIGVENMYLFAEHSQLLQSLGFEMSPFGSDTIVVNGVPEGYSAEEGKVQAMVADLVRILSEDHSALQEMMSANLASGLARLGAANGEVINDQVKAQRLIDSLFACENSEYTMSGRRIISIMPLEDIDKRF